MMQYISPSLHSLLSEKKVREKKEKKIEGNKQENCYIGTGYSSSAFVRKELQLVKIAVAVSTINRYSYLE